MDMQIYKKMVGFGGFAHAGFELIQKATVEQLTELFRTRASIQNIRAKSQRLKASDEQQDVLRIHGKPFILY